MRSQKCFDDEVISDSGISASMMTALVCIGEKVRRRCWRTGLGNSDGEMKTI